jgi:hypothetical protein
VAYFRLKRVGFHNAFSADQNQARLLYQFRNDGITANLVTVARVVDIRRFQAEEVLEECNAAGEPMVSAGPGVQAPKKISGPKSVQRYEPPARRVKGSKPVQVRKVAPPAPPPSAPVVEPSPNKVALVTDTPPPPPPAPDVASEIMEEAIEEIIEEKEAQKEIQTLSKEELDAMSREDLLILADKLDLAPKGNKRTLVSRILDAKKE